MFCSRCGLRAAEAANFCGSCGARLNQGDAVPGKGAEPGADPGRPCNEAAARMAPLIAEILAYSRANPKGDDRWVTFQQAGNEAIWAQVRPPFLNVAYPLRDSPAQTCAQIIGDLPGAELSDWEKERFAMWTFGPDATPGSIAETILRLFARFFPASDFDIVGRTER